TDVPGESGTFAHELLTAVDAETIKSICGFVINDDQVVIAELAQIAPAATSIAEVNAQPASQPTPAAAAPKPTEAAKAGKGKASAAKDNSTIRVATQRVDQLVNLVGEVVIDQAILIQACQELDPIKHATLLQGIEHMSSALRTLQENIMGLRMVRMEYAFGRYPRVVRETAAKLNKKIELHTSGGETELDKGLIEKLIDPLTHLIRNSLD